MKSAAGTRIPSMSDNSGGPLLEIERATKDYEIKKRSLDRQRRLLSAVEDVSLTIRRGETLGLVGESGSGKTTLAYLILGLVPLTSGQIRFDGIDVHGASRRELRALRRRMQIVFQDPYSSLDPRMSVGSIVAEGLRGLSKRERAARLTELLGHVGLPANFAQRHPHQLSGGQRQRVGVARALAVEPEFLILDEPVSALDVSIQSQVLNLFRDLQNELDLTYLFVSHDLAVVRHLADRIAVMYLGKLVEYAQAEEIFENPLHPYTQALLSAMPMLQKSNRRTRIMLAGDIPSPINPPPHCRFASRCFRANERSWQEVPSLEEVSEGHYVACFNYATLDEALASVRPSMKSGGGAR
jgi:oligopeptide transport system ATP-binding protein